jgi:hypothetical protein
LRWLCQRSREIVSVVDVAPTLAEALAVALAGELDGQSLFRRAVEPGRGVYFENYHNWVARGASHLSGWLDAGGKFLHSSAPEFYDLERDPGEAEDLASSAGARLEPYRAALARHARRAADAPLASADPGLDAAQEQRLQALGYATVGSSSEAFPAPLDASDRPSPRKLAQSFSWTISSSLNTTQARIRVRAIDFTGTIIATASDTSNANFTISQPVAAPTPAVGFTSAPKPGGRS